MIRTPIREILNLKGEVIMGHKEVLQIIEQIKKLELYEKEELRDLIDLAIASHSRPLTQAEFDKIMVEKGLMSIPPPITDFSRYENRKLAKVTGKPASEVIIEERR
jgi:hypothetical protein